VRAAIEVRDQCVALGGVCSSVVITTSSTWSSRIEGGRPGRGSSTSPSSRCATTRPRQRVTVPGVTRSRAATSVFDHPGPRGRRQLDPRQQRLALHAEQVAHRHVHPGAGEQFRFERNPTNLARAAPTRAAPP
jgi:hypothetical protein